MDDVSKACDQIPAATESVFSNDKTAAAVLSDNETNSGMPESSEETIRRVLNSYELGSKLRQLRLRKKIALIDLGKHTGLSASMLSQLENGKLVPTLATLARIAMVFDVSLDYFFGDRKRKRPFIVVQGGERLKFPDRPTSPKPDYFFECLAFSAQDKSLQAYLAEFPKRQPSEVVEHFHDGAEFVHVLEGSLAIRYQDEEHVLNAGDSVYFDSSEAHAYRGIAKTITRAIVVTTPPRL
jgi:transcriptional regulator with XRE-family HTH domain